MIKKNYFAKTYFYNLLELKLFSRGRQNYIIFIFERKKTILTRGHLRSKSIIFFLKISIFDKKI